ncbi:hypothetical protein D3C78_1960120 [compost metagenome]
MEDIKVNNIDCVISVEHVTEPGEGWKGSKFIAECLSMKELTSVLNDPKNQPEMYWVWKIDFQDKSIEE